MFKSILLATDGSRHAKRAADVAADLALRYGARLTLCHVAQPSLGLDEIEAMPRARRFPKETKAEMRELRGMLEKAALGSDALYARMPAPESALVALGNAVLDEAEAVARRKGVKKVVRAALVGSPADRILEQAGTSKADLVVMGTRGLSDMAGLVMGSVSHKVIHRASCACLTVK